MCAFIYLSYKILFIVKSKCKGRRIAPADAATGSSKKVKKRKIDFQNISTYVVWQLAVFFILSLPETIYSHLPGVSCLTSQRINDIVFGIWSDSFIFMNCTVNCLILFWRNSILRGEGHHSIIAKCLIWTQ